MSSSQESCARAPQQGHRSRNTTSATRDVSAPAQTVDWAPSRAAYSRIQASKKDLADEHKLIHTSLQSAIGLDEEADFSDKEEVMDILKGILPFMNEHQQTALDEAKVAAKAIKSLDNDTLAPNVRLRKEALVKQTVLYMHEVDPNTNVGKACDDLRNVVITVPSSRRVVSI
jgi:soluble cytochrome b562